MGDDLAWDTGSGQWICVHARRLGSGQWICDFAIVVLEVGSILQSCTLLLNNPDVREMRSNHSYSVQYDLHPGLTAAPLVRDSSVLPSCSWRNPYFTSWCTDVHILEYHCVQNFKQVSWKRTEVSSMYAFLIFCKMSVTTGLTF